MGHAARLLVLAFAALGCSSSSDTSSASDAAGDVASEAGCPDPSAVVAGASCSGGATCFGVEKCVQCFHDAYEKVTPQCTCTSGAWACGVYDCPGGGPFTDPACTVPTPTPDTGTDASDAAADGG